jgi:hypothetical protein
MTWRRKKPPTDTEVTPTPEVAAPTVAARIRADYETAVAEGWIEEPRPGTEGGIRGQDWMRDKALALVDEVIAGLGHGQGLGLDEMRALRKKLEAL